MIQISPQTFLSQFLNGHFLELRAIDQIGTNRENEFFSADQLDRIPESLYEYHSYNLYFGVAERFNPAGGGGTANCVSVQALFIDLDFKAVPEDDARSRLSIFRPQPSIRIFTGGGLHCYWLLKDAYDLKITGGAQRFKILLRRLAAALQADQASAEPARVLRIPGTVNHKYPRTVTIEHFDSESRFQIDDFDYLPPTFEEAQEREHAHGSGQVTDSKDRFGIMRRFRDYLAGVDEDVRQHEKRDPVTYRLAAAGCKDFGLGEDDVFTVMRDWNQFRCKPPWTENELRQKIHNANKYGKHSVGALRDQVHGDNVNNADGEEEGPTDGSKDNNPQTTKGRPIVRLNGGSLPANVTDAEYHLAEFTQQNPRPVSISVAEHLSVSPNFP